MAALTFVAGLAAASATTAGTARAADPTPVKQKVRLQIRIDGIKAKDGAEFTVKPGHPGCKFKPVTRTVKGDGTVPLEFDVETVTADRDCSFAITLKESGQPDKNVRRSLQVVPDEDGKPPRPQTLTCFVTSKSLSSNPVAGKASEEMKRKK